MVAPNAVTLKCHADEDINRIFTCFGAGGRHVGFNPNQLYAFLRVFTLLLPALIGGWGVYDLIYGHAAN